jgi:hypothetical protein
VHTKKFGTKFEIRFEELVDVVIPDTENVQEKRVWPMETPPQ